MTSTLYAHVSGHHTYLVNEVGYDALDLVTVHVLLPKVLQRAFKRLQVELMSALDQIAVGEDTG